MPSDFYNEVVNLYENRPSTEQRIRDEIIRAAKNSQSYYQSCLLPSKEASRLKKIFSNEGFKVSKCIDFGNPDEEYFLQIWWAK